MAQQMHLRYDQMRRRHPRCEFRCLVRVGGMIPDFVRTAKFQRYVPRYAFLQQKIHGTYGLFAQKPVDHDIVLQSVDDGRLNHALMMRHERRDGDKVTRPDASIRRKIKRFDKSVSGQRAKPRKFCEIFGCGLWPTAQRQSRSIGRDNQIIGQPAAYPKTGHTKARY